MARLPKGYSSYPGPTITHDQYEQMVRAAEAAMPPGEARRVVDEAINKGGVFVQPPVPPPSTSPYSSGTAFSTGIIYPYPSGNSYSFGSLQSNTPTMARKRFNVGDEVVLKNLGGYGYNPSNPEWGRDGMYISGRVSNTINDMSVAISWNNGLSNVYDLSVCEIVLLSLVKPEKVAGKKIDLKQMERLVIDEKKRAQIISVIKQHENYNKLFKDWGLGDVIEYGRGMVMLFWGNPGTGKTWAAMCIAKSLGMELLSIGAAEIETSEPGGANRNIQNAFKSANDSNKVLFIDECDSLITSRNQAGMIIAGQINTLLQEIEKFEGVCILATNRIEFLDEALERRISLILEFPEPDFAGREQIWERMLPKKMPLEDGINAKKLAEYKLTGGQIKNVLLAAARAAMSNAQEKVLLADFELAVNGIKQSQGKMGKRALQYEAVSDKIRTMGVDKIAKI